MKFILLISLCIHAMQDSMCQQKFTVPSTAGCKFETTGKNKFFILEPGYQLTLAGKDGSDSVKLVITVLNETFKVGNTVTRLVEEAEYENGIVKEISKNYFAFCPATADVWYFGEDVNNYKHGKLANHNGSWLATGKNKPGILIPGTCKPGATYYQEYAPGIAMDRAEIISLKRTAATPSGVYTDCLMTFETTPLNPKEKEFKVYAPGIGLIKDGMLLLTGYRFIEK